MKNRYLIIGIVASLLVPSLTSCEDRLDIDEHGVSPISTFYTTDSEADEAITAVYSKWSSVFSPLHAMTNLLSDEYWSGGGNHYDGNYYRLADYTFDTDYATVSTLYQDLYNVIYASNVVIENVKSESSIMNRAIAEAKVFRAMSNFYLATLWGTPPLVDHTLKAGEYSQGNCDQAAMWALIEKDLTEAISSGALTEKSSATEKTYRITKQYAQALLGKAYVFEKKWSDAVTVLDQIISSGKYTLYNDYSNINTIAGECNSECLFEINRPTDTANPSLNFDITWVYGGLRGEKYTYKNSTLCNRTFGFYNPTKSLYDAFVAEEGQNGYRLHNTILTYQQLKDEQGASIVSGMNITDNEGYYDFKNRILASDFCMPYNPPKNFRFMRLAEVYLLAAEASLEAGNATKATQYVNVIRKRAGVADLATATLNDIKNEKRLELCFEMVRYQDLIRWGDAAKVLADKGSKYPTLNADGTVTYTTINATAEHGFKTGKNELLPIPATEIQVNPNMKQNTGW